MTYLTCDKCREPVITGKQPHILSSDGRRGVHWPRCPRGDINVPEQIIPGVAAVQRVLDAPAKFRVPITDLSDATLAELVEKGAMDPATVVDMVNHPPHYTAHPSGIECIDITRLCHFALGNAIKYIWRAWDKGSYRVDLDKARFYLRDTLSNGCAHHPHHKAKAMLIEAAANDTNHDRAQMLYLIAHGQLDVVIRRIDLDKALDGVSTTTTTT